MPELLRSGTVARFRVPLGFLVAALVFYFSTPTITSMAVGIPVAWIGVVFRAAAAGVIRKDAALAREGPYRLTRNPLYFGSFMLALGFGAMSADVTSALILIVPSILVYPNVIRGEEQHLLELFGQEFITFKAQVPVFFPSRLSAHMLKPFSTSQYLANREYNAALGFVGATLILFLKYFLAGK